MGLETIANILFSKIYHKEKNTREQKSQVATLFIKKKINENTIIIIIIIAVHIYWAESLYTILY